MTSVRRPHESWESDSASKPFDVKNGLYFCGVNFRAAEDYKYLKNNIFNSHSVAHGKYVNIADLDMHDIPNPSCRLGR